MKKEMTTLTLQPFYTIFARMNQLIISRGFILPGPLGAGWCLALSAAVYESRGRVEWAGLGIPGDSGHWGRQLGDSARRRVTVSDQ